ncbi:MAG: hypothetical protein ABH873_04795 [Candidatus Firestonebacteria bacterium]
MKYIASICIVCFCIVIFFGCAGVAVKPDWVKKGSGAFPGDPSPKIYGVGVAGLDPNPAVSKEQSSTRARVEIAKTLSISVQNLVKDFMETHKDWFNLSDTAGSDEFFSSVTKTVTDQILIGSKQVDSFEDTISLYVLYSVDLGNDFFNTYKQSLKRLISDKHRAVVVEKVNEATQELDKEVDKQRQREDKILDVK